MVLALEKVVKAFKKNLWYIKGLSGRMLDSRPRGRGFKPHQHHCVVSLSKNINSSLVLVQPRKTCPFITERLLMGRKESTQTKYLSTISGERNHNWSSRWRERVLQTSLESIQ